MTTKIMYLVRHGDVDYETENYSLSKEGIAQAERLGHWLNKHHYPMPQIVASSDRPRAVQTAQTLARSLGYKLNLIKTNREPEKVQQYGELNPYHDYNGLSLSQSVDFIIDNALQERNLPPKLENQGAVTQVDWQGKQASIVAFRKFIDELMVSQDVALCVSHSNILKLVFQNMFELLDFKMFPVDCPNTAITVLIRADNPGSAWHINALFSTEHRL